MKYLLFILILLCLKTFNISAQVSTKVTTTEKITAKSDFIIAFFDTTETRTINAEITFNSGDAYTIKLTDKDSEKTGSFTLDENANYNVFEAEFNRVGKDSFEFAKSIKPTSIQDVYRMLWNIKHKAA